MKIFAVSRRKEGAPLEKFKALQKAETEKVWELYVKDIVREIYFRTDRPGGVLVLECAGVEEARQALDELPMHKEGLTEFDFIPVGPYERWSVLFS